jgi:hypothetical protein
LKVFKILEDRDDNRRTPSEMEQSIWAMLKGEGEEEE